jgi:FlaA1/EpsC-like NDP-sugar epimerase
MGRVVTLLLSPSVADLAAAVVGRTESLFRDDLASCRSDLREQLHDKRVLVVGGAGSIGSSTIRHILANAPRALHVIDVSENGLADLVRAVRGSPQPMSVDEFRTVPIDFGSPIMERFLGEQECYDVVFNFAAIKHVRSEKDVFSLLQMLDTNVVKAARLLRWLGERGFRGRYFSVSTDKAANPVNAMGASKRIMEMVTFSPAFVPAGASATSARFANVAFSNGSLLASFVQRIASRQPIAAPRNTRRFFITLAESGDICALAGVLGAPDKIVVPLLTEPDLVELATVAEIVLRAYGLEPHCIEDEARAKAAVATDLEMGRYPVVLTRLDTSGEKSYEEFVGRDEALEKSGFTMLGQVRPRSADDAALENFVERVADAIEHPRAAATKQELLGMIADLVPQFDHVETGKSLDSRL